MLINAEEINDILFDAGTEVTNRGKKYFEQNRVKVADFNFVSENNYIAKAYVEGTYIYEVEIKRKMAYFHISVNVHLHLKKIHLVSML